MKEDFDYKKYRNDLAGELSGEPKKDRRREILRTARETREYREARILHHTDAVKERERLIGGGFAEEAGAFEKVVSFAKAVESAGGKAFLVGGSVRDEIMGIPPKDFDIEVYKITPEKLKKLAESFGQVNEVGTAFGVLKVRLGNIDIDVSLPRRESKTGVGHKDFSVSADPSMSIEEAARRRDFTLNALAKDILTGEIHDFFGGIKDIEQGILCVTDEERFKDDPLRVLRGVQFVGRFGLKVEDRTAAIMREMRHELRYLPKERLREEWVKLFIKSKKPSLGLQTAMEWGIFHEMHPEVVELTKTPQEPKWHPEGNTWIHTLMVADQAAKIVEEERLNKEKALTVILAAFCHDFGKPATTQEVGGRISSAGHEEAGVGPADKFLSAIGIEASLRDAVKKLVAEHLKPSVLYIQEQRGEKVTDGAIKRLAARISPATLRQLVCLAKADHFGRGPFVSPKAPEKSLVSADYPAGDWLLNRASGLDIYEAKPRPVLSGRDLIGLGFKQDKLFGGVIRAADDLHVKGHTREQILFLIAEEKGVSLEDIITILKDKAV